LGPQQLKYITFLKDSSDCFVLSSFSLVETIEEVEESLLAWENEPTWVLRWCWADLKAWFHLQIPWSFKASTTPTLAATLHALIVELILWWSWNSSKTWLVFSWMNEDMKRSWCLYRKKEAHGNTKPGEVN